MALTRADCLIWETLADRAAIPPNPSLLEIGQANWYGDMPIAWLVGQLERRQKELLPALEEADGRKDVFRIAELFYRCLLGAQRFTAIDLHPPPGSQAHRLDLNEPVDLGEKFDVIVNTGTLEHVFDQRRALETIHEHCAVGGLMLHAGPLAGWPDHGLFHAQPGLWLDLARANAYDVLIFVYFDMNAGHARAVAGRADMHRIQWADGSMVYAVLRKKVDAPFRVPMQRVYTENADQQTVEDWRTMR
jgi:SAM-dependent methyltransferase